MNTAEHMDDLKQKVIQEMEEDGVIIRLTQDEAIFLRKLLQSANQIYTVADFANTGEYHDNKIDALMRKLRRADLC